jgi:hypothetical protein
MAVSAMAAVASPRDIRCKHVLPGWRSTTRLFAGCAVLSIFIISASAQSPEPSEDQSTIRGAVVNALTHEPVPRALVHSGDDRFATFTDSDGQFEFKLPKSTNSSALPGSSIGVIGEGQALSGGGSMHLSLSARKPGFLEYGRQRIHEEVEASPGSEVTIPLIPESLIKGRVTLSTGDPASQLTVQIYSRQVRDGLLRWTLAAMTQTNSNGEFRFAELEAGTYKLFAREYMDNDPTARLPGEPLYGFPPVYFPGASDFSDAGTIEITAGQTVEADLSLTRQPYFQVKIPVANPDSGPGMNIDVSPQGKRSPGYSLGYNSDTESIEGYLPNGNYVVEAGTYGQNSATGMVNLQVGGVSVEGQPIRLIQNSSITFKLKDEFDQTKQEHCFSEGPGGCSPQANFYPRLEPVDDFVPHSGMALPPDAGGGMSVVVGNVRPGSYWLRFNFIARMGYVSSATAGGTDLLREPLVVSSGANIPVDITLRDDVSELEAKVTGIPSHQQTEGISGSSTWIYCVPLPGSTGTFAALSSSDGTFESVQVAPGSYRVLAFGAQQSELPYRDPEAMRAYESKGQVIHLSPGEKASIELSLIPSQ